MVTTAKPVKRNMKKPASAKKKPVTASRKPPAAETKPAVARKVPVTGARKAAAKPAGSRVSKNAPKKVAMHAAKKKSSAPKRYRCRLCGYIYSPLRGEPHNGIPEGTAFEDLPKTYVCPVCGQQGKGRIGKWGFDEWRPTRYICSICGYVYDEKRGEPHRGIKPGTPFEDLPDDYTCPVCAIDPAIRVRLGRIFKQGFEPLQL